MPYLNVGKENSGAINLFYEDHGEGPPVILIHGFPLSGASWEKQLSALLDAGHRVITYDRRGFGQSSKPATGYDYDTFTDDLHRLISTLDLTDVALVGFSMGTGEVARYLSRHGSERVNRAVLVSSLPPFLLKTPDNPDGVDRSVFDALTKAIEDDRLAFCSAFLSEFFNLDVLGHQRVSDRAVAYDFNVAAAASPIATLACISAWLTDFREDVRRIHVPVLIVHGTSDRVLPFGATGGRLPRLIEGSRLVTIDGAPHGLIWTHASELNRHLVDFLGQNRLSGERQVA
jgi:pimeloyl-ACP methyl ester carboxylesterase